MERKEIKCPVCGNNEFIEIGEPYHVGFETYIQDFTKYYGCTNCGLILRFGKGCVRSVIHNEFLQTEEGKKWKKLKDELSSLERRLQGLANQLYELNQEKKDPNRTVARDEKIGEEIKAIDAQIIAEQKRADSLRKEIAELEKLEK